MHNLDIKILSGCWYYDNSAIGSYEWYCKISVNDIPWMVSISMATRNIYIISYSSFAYRGHADYLTCKNIMATDDFVRWLHENLNKMIDYTKLLKDNYKWTMIGSVPDNINLL